MDKQALKRVNDVKDFLYEFDKRFERRYRLEEISIFFEDIKKLRMKKDISGKSYFDILRDANIFSQMFKKSLSNITLHPISNFMLTLKRELGDYILRNVSEKQDAIEIACRFGHLEVVQYILSDPEFDPTFKNNRSFIEACRSGNLNLVSLLMSERHFASSHPNFFYEALANAIESRNVGLVRFLLNDGRFIPDVELLNLAVEYDPQMVHLVLNRGVIPDNETFINACRNGELELARFLLDRYPIDPAADDNQAFLEACDNRGAVDVVRFLLTVRGIDPTARNDSALLLAVVTGNIGLIHLLLQDGRIDPTKYDNFILDKACFSGNIEVVRALLDDDRFLHTDISEALRIATYENHLDVIRLLKNYKLKTHRLNIHYTSDIPPTGYNFETLEDEPVEGNQVALAEFGMPVGYEEPEMPNVVQFLVNGQSLLLSRDFLESIVSDEGDHGSWFYECTGPELDNGDKPMNKFGNTPYILIPLHYQIFVQRDTLRRVLQLHLKTVKVVPVLNPDGTHKSFTHSISWANSHAPISRRNFVSASHCQNNSNIDIYDLVAIHRVHPYKMEPVGGLAGYGKKKRSKQLRRKRQTRRK